jgi:hypothetical protein
VSEIKNCFAGNKTAAETSAQSLKVQKDYKYLQAMADMIGENTPCSVMNDDERKKLRNATVEALNDKACLLHRAGLSQERKTKIVKDLIAAKFINDKDEDEFLHKLIDSGFVVPKDGADLSQWIEAGVFPPVVDELGDCPHFPQPFTAAPGSRFGGHHSYPGGLVIHEANNERAALNLRQQNLESYGGGLEASPDEGIICRDLLIAAPLWHDWAKPIVFQWDKNGRESPEITIAGTGAHHILGLAETMKRGLPQVFVITQASAHGCGPQSEKCDSSTKRGEEQVADWIRAAAIIAGVDDPIRAGYLRKERYFDRYYLAPLPLERQVEYFLHNLSDADYHYSEQAVTTAEAILKEVAWQFGFDPLLGDYNNEFRNPVLSNLTAEHIWMVCRQKGSSEVIAELRQLCAAGRIKSCHERKEKGPGESDEQRRTGKPSICTSTTLPQQ